MSKRSGRHVARFSFPPSGGMKGRLHTVGGPQIRSDFFPARVLVGWLPDSLDARYLCGDHRPSPSPELVNRNRLLIRIGQREREKLPRFLQEEAVSPLDVSYSGHSLDLHRHPNFRDKLRDGFVVRQIDLRQICGLQPVIGLFRVRQMMTSIQPPTAASIAALSLPLAVPAAPLPTIPFASVFTSIGVHLFSYLQVVKIHERYLLTDGYHRALAFLKAGIFSVPGLFREGTSVEEAGMGRIGELPGQLLDRARPPLLTDFLIDGLAATLDR